MFQRPYWLNQLYYVLGTSFCTAAGDFSVRYETAGSAVIVLHPGQYPAQYQTVHWKVAGTTTPGPGKVIDISKDSVKIEGLKADKEYIVELKGEGTSDLLARYTHLMVEESKSMCLVLNVTVSIKPEQDGSS